jgi:cytochrome c oxidase cbb3-type subunit 3
MTEPPRPRRRLERAKRFKRFVDHLGIGLLVSALLTSAGAGCQHKPTQSPQVAHGSELYGRMCAVCHGAAGEGYKADRAPRIAHPDFLGTVSDEFLRHAIANGRRNTTMSAWAVERGGPLSKSDVDALIAFVRSWDHGPRLALDEHPLSGDAKNGEATYTRSCAGCHGPRGVYGPNTQLGDPDLLATASNGFLRHAIRKGRTGTPMPSFEKSLGTARIEEVVAALRSFKDPARPAELQAPATPPPIPLGPVPLNPKGPEPAGFKLHPGVTSLEVVKTELDRHARFALLDARAPSDYANEHIAGAVSVPFYDPKPYLEKLPKNVWLVCYCACPHAESGRLAEQLVANGFKKVTVLDEGLGVWKSKKYPTHTGRSP